MSECIVGKKYWTNVGKELFTWNSENTTKLRTPDIVHYIWDTIFVYPEVRSEERRILEWAGYVQSLTVGVAPVIVVIASVCTFTLHMALGNDLTAAQVKRTSLHSVLNSEASVNWLILGFLSVSTRRHSQSLLFLTPWPLLWKSHPWWCAPYQTDPWLWKDFRYLTFYTNNQVVVHPNSHNLLQC